MDKGILVARTSCSGERKRRIAMNSLNEVVRSFLKRKAGFDDLRQSLAELERSESYTIAFSKRFTSPVMGWPFPMSSDVERSSPGHVGGVRAWIRLQMSIKESEALLRYASKKVQYCRVELLGEGTEVIGREAHDMTSAKGFHTPRPGMPIGDDIPAITVADVAKWLQETYLGLGRAEVELAVDLGFAETEQAAINGHKLLKVAIGEQAYLLPDPAKPDKTTDKAVRYLWDTFSGKAEKADQLWSHAEMVTNEGEVAVNTSYFAGDKEPKRLIRTKFPGLLAVEVFHPHGRYLWFATDESFDATGSGYTSSDMYEIAGTGQYLHKGYYRNNLPGEWQAEGWEFALKLHQALSRIEHLEFRVSSPRHWSTGGLTVDFSVEPSWLHYAVQQQFGFVRGEIPARLWSDELASQITEFIESQERGCLDCGAVIESELIRLDSRLCLAHLFGKFGLEVPRFQSGSFKYNDPNLKNWDFAVAHGFTDHYHLYSGNPDACRLLACVKQEPYDVSHLCDIDFCGHGGNDVAEERKRMKIAEAQGSKLVFIRTAEALKPGSFSFHFCPNPGYSGNTWIVARLEDVSDEAVTALEKEREDYLEWQNGDRDDDNVAAEEAQES
ncbi:MAG: hypothetical protein KGJ58_04085 [Patescibacteria group bacterium]|nr:hypothetical protein [Patescibacteria group bacterium]MDE2218601.1 hypothetical protein [Patescibacteria group bacterium]